MSKYLYLIYPCFTYWIQSFECCIHHQSQVCNKEKKEKIKNHIRIIQKNSCAEFDCSNNSNY